MGRWTAPSDYDYFDEVNGVDRGPMARCANCDRDFAVDQGETLPIRPWCPVCVQRGRSKPSPAKVDLTARARAMEQS